MIDLGLTGGKACLLLHSTAVIYCGVTLLTLERRKDRETERKTMGKRPATYWVLVLVALAMVVAALMMRYSADSHYRGMAQYIVWGALALFLIARFFFRGKPDSTPPMPRD